MSAIDDYRALCAAKRPKPLRLGLSRTPELSEGLFDHQRHGVEFALRAGRSALFYDTGLGKTRMMLEWGRCVVEEENKPVLMLAPLAVSAQHLREAEAMGVDAVISRFGSPPASPKIVVTNYERLERFDPGDYAGVILDESSILKSFTGVTTRKLIDTFSKTRFRLCGSATPAPNDHAELGQHSEFLGALSATQMLTRWFIHDSADTGTWRMKGHAVRDFWDWVASWARCVSKPSDLGFSDEGFVLPPLNIERHIVASDRSINAGEEKDGQQRLFRIPDRSATAIHKEKRLTAEARAQKTAEIVFGDWECLGSPNTPPHVAQNINRATMSGRAENHKDDPQTKMSSTCENTTNETLKNSNSTKPRRRKRTNCDASDTRLMPSIESDAKSKLEVAASSQSATAASSSNSESPQQITTPSLPPKEVAAPFAVQNSDQQDKSDCTSITATQPAESEDCFAQTATKELENSETILTRSEGQQDTLKDRDWWIVWCDTDYEQEELERVFGSAAISIRGSQSADRKEELHESWIRGDKKILICKPVMFGHGLNWQFCCKMAFCGLSFSYEAFYQAVRRCYRFRQTRSVQVHIICADTEAEIAAVIQRKSDDHGRMKEEMAAAMSRAVLHAEELRTYEPNQEARLPAWLA